MSDWKMTDQLHDELVEIEKREDAGEDVWNTRPAELAARTVAKANAELAAQLEADRQTIDTTSAAIGTGSKKSRAIALYNTLTDTSRPAVITSLVDQLGIKKTTASTYAVYLRNGTWS